MERLKSFGHNQEDLARLRLDPMDLTNSWNVLLGKCQVLTEDGTRHNSR